MVKFDIDYIENVEGGTQNGCPPPGPEPSGESAAPTLATIMVAEVSVDL